MIKKLVSTALFSLALGSTAAYAAEMGAKDETIKLTINEWTGQHISSHIAG
jgi:glycine betaine/proline transport system substrate-binding protein